tara:strand:+ start:289 stop:933 length:645 start_codon:yes stop_codon:yes gene_type:complete
MIPISQISHANPIMFLVILVSISFIGFLRAYYWKHTKLILLAPFQYRYASQYLKQDNVFTQRVNWLTFFILLINFSLLIDINPIVTEYFNDYIYVLLFLLIFYIMKFLLLNFLGRLLFIEEITKLTIFYSFLSDKALSIIVTPFVLILYFFSFNLDVLILSVILFLALCFVISKLYWIWKVGTNSFGLSSIYIFLYLCILEIYPFVLITKGFFY